MTMRLPLLANVTAAAFCATTTSVEARRSSSLAVAIQRQQVTATVGRGIFDLSLAQEKKAKSGALVCSIRKHKHRDNKANKRALMIRGGAQQLLNAVDIDKLLNILDMFGTAVFAFSGALTAGKKGMDLLGMLIIATITACGGGTVRDLLLFQNTQHLQQEPLVVSAVFWMQDVKFLQICAAMTLLTFFFWPSLEQKMGWKGSEVPICTADALGLAAFCVLGTQKAASVSQSSGHEDLHPMIWVISGLMSASFGGVVRDVLCLQRPRIMYPERTLYATPPLLGSSLYTVLMLYCPDLGAQAIATIAFLFTFMFRVWSFNNPIRNPHWRSIEPDFSERDASSDGKNTRTVAAIRRAKQS